MPAEGTFHLLVQMPRERLFEEDISSLRVPTETGQVGLHTGHEETVLAVEPGLVLVRMGEEWRFIGTAGGLISSDGNTARLLTPLAVVGDSAAEAVAALDQALAEPNSEMQARAKLSRLEAGIVTQLRRPGRNVPTVRITKT
jgi:F-type H+-transporting ATPase subunit epsilon